MQVADFWQSSQPGFNCIVYHRDSKTRQIHPAGSDCLSAAHWLCIDRVMWVCRSVGEPDAQLRHVVSGGRPSVAILPVTGFFAGPALSPWPTLRISSVCLFLFAHSVCVFVWLRQRKSEECVASRRTENERDGTEQVYETELCHCRLCVWGCRRPYDWGKMDAPMMHRERGSLSHICFQPFLYHLLL